MAPNKLWPPKGYNQWPSSGKAKDQEQAIQRREDLKGRVPADLDGVPGGSEGLWFHWNSNIPPGYD